MKTLIAAVLGIVLLLIISTPAFADGGYFGSNPSEDIYQPAQKAIILHENGREDLILQVKYEGDVDEFAWVIPVPNYPDVDVSEPEMFEELAYFTAVEVYDSDGGIFVCLPAGGGFEASKVDVWEEDVAGIYQYAILSAEDPHALIDWLNTNGYYFPEDGEEIIDHYIDKEWYFVAIKVNIGEEAEGLAEGTIQPLKLSFDSDNIVYPLKITSLSSDRCEVLLYVFADQEVVPKEYQYLSLNSAEQVIFLEREEDVFYLECQEQIYRQNSTYCLSYPSDDYFNYELQGFSSLLGGDQYFLTKMRINIGADNMVDIDLIVYEEEQYPDSDGDGWSDEEEAIVGTNPNTVDTDGDGTPDPEDPYPLKSGDGWCFIATAAYGSHLDSHVEILRSFRDSYLMTNPVGRGMVSVYYQLSLPMARLIDDNPILKPIVRAGLLPAIALSTVAVNTTLVQKVAIVGGLLLFAFALVWWLIRRTPNRVHSDP